MHCEVRRCLDLSERVVDAARNNFGSQTSILEVLWDREGVDNENVAKDLATKVDEQRQQYGDERHVLERQ